jgi:hypothetical protein
MRIRAFVGLVVLGLAAAACGGGDDDDVATGTPTGSAFFTPTATPGLPNPPGNLLRNPGFEEGTEPWISLDPESSFELSPDAAFTGATSAVLHMDDGTDVTGTKVYYLVQELAPTSFPEVLKGAYRVTNWNKGTAKQYIQVVVIAIGADNNPTEAENFQIRYILAGVDDAPLNIGNAKYVFFSHDEPILNGWLAFETNVMQDFDSVWGVVPHGYEKIRVLFEVRFDDKGEGDHSTADVFYDDLYLGSAE